MNNKLTPKDLITTGIFTAIYYAVFFVSAMLGYIPVFFIILPVYLPLLTAIPAMLFFSKVDKFGMVTIMALISGLLMFVTGHTWIPVPLAVICGLLADLVMKAGNYTRFSNIAVGYGLFSIWPIGAMLPMWVMRESYFEYMRSVGGDALTDKIWNMTPNWLPFVLVPAAFLSGIAGAFIGKSILKKHFKKAGII